MSQHIKIKFKDGNGQYVPVGFSQIRRIYDDDLGPCVVVMFDEVAELWELSKLKTIQAKKENEYKSEITSISTSIAQLGRNSNIHIVLATQRNDAKVIPGSLQNNPLDVDTQLNVKEKHI